MEVSNFDEYVAVINFEIPVNFLIIKKKIQLKAQNIPYPFRFDDLMV